MNSSHGKIMNPQTNRFVKVGSQKHKRLIMEGVLLPEDDFSSKLKETCTDIVESNSDAFTSDLSQDQIDTLLKKMLYEKLCIQPIKKKKKKKKKIVYPSSSESESESD
jgi:hypothetical protein